MTPTARGALVRDVRPARVFHLAALASVKRSWDEPERTIADNQAMTLRCSRPYAHEAPGARVLIAGTGEVYGAPALAAGYRGRSARPSRTRTRCRRRAATCSACLYERAWDLAVVRTRAFNHAGPGQSDDYVVGTLTRQVAAAEVAGADSVAIRTGNPDSARDFTDVRDVVRAYAAAIELESGAYNVASERSLTVNDLIDAIRGQTRLEVQHEVDPDRVRHHDVQRDPRLSRAPPRGHRVEAEHSARADDRGCDRLVARRAGAGRMTCPACGGEATTWLAAPGSEPADTTLYEIARCSSCGSGATLGADPAADAYSSGIYAERSPRLPRLVGLLRRIAVRLPLRALRRSGVDPPAAVLDAGAGSGRLVAALAARGYDAEGIDTAPRGENVRRAGILEHSATDRGAVVMWHALEHMADPRAAVGRAAGWLRPGGVLLVAVPNLASLQARIAGREWFHLDLPRHRTHFTPAGLRACMRGAGIEPGRTWHLVPEHNFHGMWFALLTRLGMTPGFPFHALKRNAPLRPRDLALVVLAGPLLLPVAVVLELAAGAARRGGTIVMAGRA